MPEHISSALYHPIEQRAQDNILLTNGNDGAMQLDNTRDKVYIHDLDEELRDVESEEEKLIFLPDIEKHLTMIPKSLLVGHNPPPTNNQMVLYNVPTSLTIPQEQDNVRKAIIESRARARQKALNQNIMHANVNLGVEMPENHVLDTPNAGQDNLADTYAGEDDDAMDIG